MVINNKTAVALGSFDGLHTGHMSVIACALSFRECGLIPYVMLFDSHPLKALTGKAPAEILQPSLRKEILDERGVGTVLISFEEIKSLSCREFFTEILLKKLNAGAVCCGSNYRFGKNGSGGADELRSEIEHCLDELAKDMSARAGVAYPDTVVAVGNSAMLHLLTGTDPSPLAAAPFILGRYFGEWEGGRYYPPCISAYVGADMTAAILASDMCKEGKTALLLDVGTNGEMALLHEGKLLCCSTAAGPAFEGAGISCGSLAIPGAICAVTACEGALRCETIDGKPAVGLCGTGLIDAIAALLELGALEDSGFMEEDAPLGDSGLTLTRADIRQVQLAKAAIRAGIDTLLIEAGVGYEEIDTVYLAGGFGSYLHPESCAAIGMIPRELIGKLRVLGNAAGQGASLMLLSAEELAAAEDIAKSATTLELSSSMVFMEKYVDSMMF
jgi:uncharacterized 2Fe-2S/4Fe-4S cluster protein (DUF4445 family)